MNDLQSAFARIGFQKHDAGVYLALKKNELNVSELARKARTHRPAVYASLKRLCGRGLVLRGTRKKRVTYRQASSVRLNELVRASERDITKTLKRVLGTQPHDTGAISTLKGRGGIRSVLTMMLESLPKNGIFYRYSSRSANMDIERYMPHDYREIRDKKRIQQFAIVNDRLRRGPWKKRLDASSKVVPVNEDPFEYGVNVLIFGDTIAIVNFADESAYVIRDKKVAEMQRGIFKLLYNRFEK